MAVALPHPRALAGRPVTAAVATACTAWACLVVAGHLLGARLVAADPLVHIGAPPLVGRFDWAGGTRLLPALLLAVAVLAAGPIAARGLPWRGLLAGAWALAAAWAILLALGDGGSALTAPLESRYEYLAAVGRVGSPGSFLDGFVAQLATYPTHVKGHPPGILLAFWGLAQAGLGGAVPATVLVIGAGALAAPAALVTVRLLAGEDAARGAAPLLALTPGAVWVATSGDALVLGVSACGIAAMACALHGTRRSAGWALTGGLLLGAALMCSYGVAPLGAVVLALAWTARDRALRVLVVAGVGVLAVFLAFGALGFWWPEGLRATHELYAAGVASRRPYLDFLIIAAAAFALALGPAAAAGLVRTPPPLRVLVAGALVAVAAADLSGLSRGENERIWLLFVPWVLCAAVALGSSRRWLAAQLALALVLQAGVRSPW